MQCRMVVTDILGQHIGPILKSQAVQEKFFLDSSTLKVGTYRLSGNVGNKIPFSAL